MEQVRDFTSTSTRILLPTNAKYCSNEKHCSGFFPAYYTHHICLFSHMRTQSFLQIERSSVIVFLVVNADSIVDDFAYYDRSCHIFYIHTYEMIQYGRYVLVNASPILRKASTVELWVRMRFIFTFYIFIHVCLYICMYNCWFMLYT